MFEYFAVRSVLACAVDHPVAITSTLKGTFSGEVIDCTTETVAESLDNPEQQYDAVCFYGNVTWHSLRAIEAALAPVFAKMESERRRLPILVVDAGVPDGPPDWLADESLPAQFRRGMATRDGVRLAFGRLVDGYAYSQLWVPVPTVIGLAVPNEQWKELGPLAAMIESLSRELANADQRATEAIALAYQASLVEDTEEDIGFSPKDFGIVLAKDLSSATANASEAGVEAARLVRRPDGRVFLLDSGKRKHINSTLVVKILARQLGAVSSISPEDLEAYKKTSSVTVIRGSKGSYQIVLNNKRIMLRGFPVVSFAAEEDLENLEVLTTISLSKISFDDELGGREMLRRALSRAALRIKSKVASFFRFGG
ncbi:hypothetical protein [Shimia sp.]|uniref:hypothetical protein n=1 Tax=Shimia sp. TaxID=1954381 RepID=UPI003B8D79CC